MALAKVKIESLERQLVWRDEKMTTEIASQKELRQRVLQYHHDFQQEKQEIFEITADMTRQYKGPLGSSRLVQTRD